MKQCVVCSGGVGPRHHAVECDQCHEWTHRRCNTGISLEAYRAAVSVDADISYICSVCAHLVPDREVEYQEHEHEDLQTTVMEVGEGDRTFDSIISGNMSDGDDHEKTKTDMDPIHDEEPPVLEPLVHFDEEPPVVEQSVRFDEIDPSFFPGDFYSGEVKVGAHRHVIFATTQQLRLLKQARRWYIDGTFNVVREPFQQLMSIQAFVRKGDDAKQLPLIFVLMTRRTTRDYVKILKKIGRLLDCEPQVDGIVMDFEAAVWNATRAVLPGVTIKGCCFHWTQAVWRKVQNLGLATEYRERGSTHKFVRKLLALPFLPAEHIDETFGHLKDYTLDHLEPLVVYVENTWMQSLVWPPENWSVYGQSVRTNNDVEGWHRRLNFRAGGTPPFHNLVMKLHQESQVASIQVNLVSENRLRKYQKSRYTSVQAKLFDAWDSYREEKMTTTQLLRICSTIMAPSTD